MATAISNLTTHQWLHVRTVLPSRRRFPDRQERQVIEGMLYAVCTGCRWRDLPAQYGDSERCRRRYGRWAANGAWERVWLAFLHTLDPDWRINILSALTSGAFIPYRRRAVLPSIAPPRMVDRRMM